jgi:hypothetical protein
MKRNLFVRFFAFMSAIILVAATAHAQSTATVQGTVLDTQKAAVPGRGLAPSRSTRLGTFHIIGA